MKHYPFNDCEMTYDTKKHRYILVAAYVEDTTGISLGSLNKAGLVNAADRANIFLDKVSDFIYRYIYKHAQNKNYVEFMLAKAPALRDVIRDAMIEQVRYWRENGDIGLETGVNLKDGRAMEPVQLRGVMRISADAYDILLNAGLLYTGTYRVPMGMCYREDY